MGEAGLERRCCPSPWLSAAEDTDACLSVADSDPGSTLRASSIVVILGLSLVRVFRAALLLIPTMVKICVLLVRSKDSKPPSFNSCSAIRISLMSFRMDLSLPCLMAAALLSFSARPCNFLANC